jgi:hypothetical protein
VPARSGIGIDRGKRRDRQRLRNQARLKLADRAPDDLFDLGPPARGRECPRERRHAEIDRGRRGLRIPFAVDQIFDAGRIEQEGQIALDDVAHLRARDGVLAGRLGLPLRRIVP